MGIRNERTKVKPLVGRGEKRWGEIIGEGAGEEDYQKGVRIVCHVGMVQWILVIGTL